MASSGAHRNLTVVPLLRGGNPAAWTRYLFTADANAPDSALSFEHGQWVCRVIGGTGTQSNRREAWRIPGCPAALYGSLKSRWASHPAADGVIEHGHMLNLQTGGDGKIRSAIVWDFGFGNVLGGVWEANPDGTAFVAGIAPLRDLDAATAAVRASNVVTATVPAGAATRWAVGDIIVADFADNTYDGTFVITAVPTDTTIRWAQTAADDPAAGAGTVTLLGRNSLNTLGRARLYTDLVRAAGVVTTTGLAAGHPYQVGDRVTVDATDATYDGPRFPITAVNPFTAQIAWLQAAADDASGGAGTLSKTAPHWLESRLLPGNILQARFWPDAGDPTGSAAGLTSPGPPPWESQWSQTWDLSLAPGVTLPTGVGFPALVAAHHSSNSPVRHDSVEWSLSQP